MIKTRRALTALMDNRIDHSGVFPPTALSFEDAMTKAVHFPSILKHPHIIACEMILPISEVFRIDESLLKKLDYAGSSFRIGAIDNSSLQDSNSTAFSKNISALLKYNDQNLRSKVISYELKVSSLIYSNLKSALELGLAEGGEFTIFIEPNLSSTNWLETIETVLPILRDLNSGLSTRRLGFKVRTSGPEALSVEKLAQVIKAVSDSNLPFKVTGGLHYPFPINDRPHGFLSLTLAVLLSRGFQLSIQEISRILKITSEKEFELTEVLKIYEHKLSAEQIASLISKAHFTIGCCNPIIQDSELERIFA